MEKYGDYEIRITKKEGRLVMQLPGNLDEIPYDSRFTIPDIMALKEGETYVVPKED